MFVEWDCERPRRFSRMKQPNERIGLGLMFHDARQRGCVRESEQLRGPRHTVQRLDRRVLLKRSHVFTLRHEAERNVVRFVIVGDEIDLRDFEIDRRAVPRRLAFEPERRAQDCRMSFR